MPANTTHGYPYPVGTDRVMDGDNQIQALAEKVDTNLAFGVASGSVVVNIAALNTPASAAVTFPVGRFTTGPAIAVSQNTGSPHTNMVSVGSVTAAGFTMWASRTAGTIPISPTCFYVAHGT